MLTRVWRNAATTAIVAVRGCRRQISSTAPPSPTAASGAQSEGEASFRATAASWARGRSRQWANNFSRQFAKDSSSLPSPSPSPRSLRLPLSFLHQKRSTFAEKWQVVLHTLSTLGGVSCLPPGTVTAEPARDKFLVYYDTAEAYVDMWKAVDSAKRSVVWHTYICKDDTVGRATIERLVAARARGVDVTLLWDSGGNITGRDRLMASLRESGALVVQYRPFFPHMFSYFFVKGMRWQGSPAIRNHRKIVIVDDRVGFIGGLNVGDDYAGARVGGNGRFRDTMCRVEGPAVRCLAAACRETSDSEKPLARPIATAVSRWRTWAGRALRFRASSVMGSSVVMDWTQGGRQISGSLHRRRVQWRERSRKFISGGRWNLVSRHASRVANLSTVKLPFRSLRFPPSRVPPASERADAPSPNVYPGVGGPPIAGGIPLMTQVIGCNPMTRNWSLQMAFWLVSKRSQRSLHVTTPYFLPNVRLANAVLAAAARGVDVRVLQGAHHSTDPWFMWYASQYITRRMLNAGVKIYEYQQRDSIMHAKTVVVDGVWAAVGSYNWDMMSNKNLEASITSTDASFVAQVEDHFQRDLALSRQLTLEEFDRRSIVVRVASWVFFHSIRLLEILSFWTYDDPELASLQE